MLARMLHRYELTHDPSYELSITERLTLMPEGFELGLTLRTPSGGSARDDAGDQAESGSSRTCPASSIDQSGLNATSHGCPSGSAKYPE